MPVTTRNRPAPRQASPTRRDPQRTKERILAAATAEFSEHGLGGARVDAIAARAGTNKRMLYHHFGNKEALFRVVLEHMYEQIRTLERALDLDHLEPIEAVGTLVAFTFGYFVEHPEFIRLLNNENLHGARHIADSQRIRALHSPLIERIRAVLERGAREGTFRADVDPVQLYITIASVGYFYLSNVSTLSAIFGRDLATAEALAERVAHASEVVLGYLRPVAR